MPAEPGGLPPIGAEVELALNWGRRHAHMRMHTALHLLSVVVPLPVTGGAIAEGAVDSISTCPTRPAMATGSSATSMR